MNDYISKIDNLIKSCFVITAYQLHTDRKSEDMAFISGRIDFIEGSSLDFKEFVEKTFQGVEKYKYGYNYRKNSKIIFRCDNAPDPRAKHLNSFPHHRHTEEGNLVESHVVTLFEVLEQIQQRILTYWAD